MYKIIYVANNRRVATMQRFNTKEEMIERLKEIAKKGYTLKRVEYR